MAEKVQDVDSGMLWMTFFSRSAAASKSFNSNIEHLPRFLQDRFIISLSIFDCKISGHITLHYYIILFNMYKESAFPAVCVHCGNGRIV